MTDLVPKVEPLVDMVVKEEPLDQKEPFDQNENDELDCSKVKIGSDLLEILIKTTITCAQLEDLIVQSVPNLNIEGRLGSYSVVITRNNHVYFPNVPEKNPSYAEEPSDEKFLERSELNVVLNPFRIVISGTTLKASLQVCGVEKATVTNVIQFNNVWKVSEEILPLLNIVSSNGSYNVCGGFSNRELRINSENWVKPLSLVTREIPFLRHESPKCTYVAPSQIIRNRCSACLRWFHQMKRNFIDKSDKNQYAKTDASSKTTFAHLSPKELKMRLGKLQKERKNLRKKVQDLEKKLKRAENKLYVKEGKAVLSDNISDNDNGNEDVIEINDANKPIPDGMDDIINKSWVDDDDLLNEPIPDDPEVLDDPFLDDLNNLTNNNNHESFSKELKGTKRKNTFE